MKEPAGKRNMVDANDALTYSPETSRMIWIDCEMTGLDIFHDELCEVSVVPTDFELQCARPKESIW